MSDAFGRRVYLKLEVFQKTGAFKFRGAMNRLMLLDAGMRENGVVTASSGNHGLGMSLGSRILGIDGVFAEYAVVPEENLWFNDPAIPPDVASVQEPLGNAVHTVMAGETRGKSFAVFGCGPIGLMAIGVAKAVGGTLVVAADINEYRLGLARDMGADLVINSAKDDPVEAVLNATKGVGVDAVLEMSGAAPVYDQMLRVVRAGGRVALLGLPSRPLTMNFSDNVVMRGVTLQGITGRRMWETWVMSRDLLRSGRLNLSPLITHRLDLKDFAQGMDLMTSGNSGKVILYPEGLPSLT